MVLETWKHAHNLQVVTRTEGCFVGRLDDFLFDLESHKIYGWRLKTSGVFGKSGGIASDHLELLGRDVAIVRSEADVEWGRGVGPVDGRAWASDYRGTQALTRRGQGLGAVQDFVLDREGNRVTGLVLQGSLVLPLDGRVQTGGSAIIVESDDVVVEIPASESDEPTNWWHRVREAVGGRGARGESAVDEEGGE